MVYRKEHLLAADKLCDTMSELGIPFEKTRETDHHVSLVSKLGAEPMDRANVYAKILSLKYFIEKRFKANILLSPAESREEALLELTPDTVKFDYNIHAFLKVMVLLNMNKKPPSRLD